MTAEDADRLTPYQKELMDELRKLRVAIQDIVRIWEKMANG